LLRGKRKKEGARISVFTNMRCSLPIAGVMIGLLDIDEMRGEKTEQPSG
jgi:hypothetical protein